MCVLSVRKPIHLERAVKGIQILDECIAFCARYTFQSLDGVIILSLQQIVLKLNPW